MKDKLVAGLLGIFIGGFGVHKFYLGQTGWGIVYVLFCWTFIPSVAGFIEGIMLIAQDQASFDAKHNVGIASPYAQLEANRQVMGQADLLLKFKQLHNEGAITDEEFEAAKRKTLGL